MRGINGRSLKRTLKRSLHSESASPPWTSQSSASYQLYSRCPPKTCRYHPRSKPVVNKRMWLRQRSSASFKRSIGSTWSYLSMLNTCTTRPFSRRPADLQPRDGTTGGWQRITASSAPTPESSLGLPRTGNGIGIWIWEEPVRSTTGRKR